jgi:hypothetical protein
MLKTFLDASSEALSGSNLCRPEMTYQVVPLREPLSIQLTAHFCCSS